MSRQQHFSKDETPNKRFYFFKIRDNQFLSSRFVRAARANLVEVKKDRRDKQVVSLSIRNKQTSVSVNPTNLKQLQPGGLGSQRLHLLLSLWSRGRMSGWTSLFFKSPYLVNTPVMIVENIESVECVESRMKDDWLSGRATLTFSTSIL